MQCLGVCKSKKGCAVVEVEGYLGYFLFKGGFTHPL